MTILEWMGEIGWDLWVPELKRQLKDTKGDDVTVRFSSIGGSIFEGGDMFNMLSDHLRDNPGIKMNLEIKSVAASFGSLIASSPVWDEITIEPTSMFMLHNPWSIAIGDFMAMQSEADFLKSARDMYIGIYAAASDQSVEEITEMMNDETWLFGQEIVDAGFADKIAEQPELSDPQDKILSLAAMKARFKDMKKRQKKLSEDEGFNQKRAAACLRTDQMTVTSFKSSAKLIDTPWDKSASETRWRNHVGVDSNEDLPKASYTKRFAYYDPDDNQNFGAYKFPHWDHNSSDGEFVNIAAVRNGLARVGNSNIPADEKPRVESLLRRYLDKFNAQQDTSASSSVNNNPVQAGNLKTEVPMDKAELKKENPAVYDESVKDGIDKERERVKKLSEMKATDDYKDIPEVVAVIEKGIVEGDTIEEVNTKMQAAMVKLYKKPGKIDELESPLDLTGGNPAPVTLKTEKQREV